MKKERYKFLKIFGILFVMLVNVKAYAQEDIGVSAVINPSGTVCSTNFSATVTLENFGLNNVTSASILYNIDGAPNSTKSWSGTLTPGNTVNVVISGLSAAAGSHVFNAQSSAPNGGVDSNASNDASVSSFTVSTPISYGTTVTNASCGNSDGAIVVNASGGVGTLQYSNDGGTTFQAGNTFSGLSLGNYTIVVEGSNGCRKMGTEKVLSNGGPSIVTVNGTSPACYNEASGSLVIAATGNGLTYSNNGGQSYQSLGYFPNLPAGTYAVFVKDNAGCETFENVTLTNPTQITTLVFGTNANCNNTNGSTSVIANGGAGNYSYQWDDPSNQTAPSASNLDVGFYHVTVSDGNGCSVEDSVLIRNVNGPQVTITSSDLLCNNDSSGEAMANVAGGTAPYLYTWNDGSNQTSQTATNLPAGIYQVLVADNNGCKGIGVAYISEPEMLNGELTGIKTSCGMNNGVAVIQVTGGTPEYSYLWSSSTQDTLLSIVNLSPGYYSVQVKDANNCSFIDSVEILPSSSMSVSDSLIHESCAGLSDGSISITISGGMEPYDILWSTGATDSVIMNIGSGQYIATVTDADGCEIEKEISIVSESSECVVIPTAFSPNNDGKNDFFVIVGVDLNKVIGVSIFNRWGDIIYQNDDYQNDWNGQYNGKDVTAGSYHCVITLDQESYYMGPITILR